MLGLKLNHVSKSSDMKCGPKCSAKFIIESFSWFPSNYINARSANHKDGKTRLKHYFIPELTNTKSCGIKIISIHWGWVTHICDSNLIIIGSDNGWTNAGILLIGSLGTNFVEILIEIHKFSLKKRNLKMSSAKWRPCCLTSPLLLTWFNFNPSMHK